MRFLYLSFASKLKAFLFQFYKLLIFLKCKLPFLKCCISMLNTFYIFLYFLLYTKYRQNYNFFKYAHRKKQEDVVRTEGGVLGGRCRKRIYFTLESFVLLCLDSLNYLSPVLWQGNTNSGLLAIIFTIGMIMLAVVGCQNWRIIMVAEIIQMQF